MDNTDRLVLLNILANMLDCDPSVVQATHPGLWDRVVRIDTMVSKAKPAGGLCSRQTLAVIVEQYLRDSSQV